MVGTQETCLAVLTPVTFSLCYKGHGVPLGVLSLINNKRIEEQTQKKAQG